MTPIYFLQNVLARRPEIQETLQKLHEAQTLQAMAMPAMKSGQAVAACALETELTARGQAPTDRPLCPKCGQVMESKGFVGRKILSLCGWITWKRRVFRNRCGCGMHQAVTADASSGIEP